MSVHRNKMRPTLKTAANGQKLYTIILNIHLYVLPLKAAQSKQNQKNSQTFWRIQHLDSHDRELFNDGRRAQRLLFNFWDEKMYLSSIPFIKLSTAVITRGDPHCRRRWKFALLEVIISSNNLHF